MKRLLTCILVVAMLMTLCVPAFADEAADAGSTADPKAGNLTTLEGASVRLKEESGLRFQTKIDKDFYDSHEMMKMGTLIAPKAYVDEAGAFTKEALEGLNKTGAKYLDVVSTAFYDEAEYTIAGSVVNIKENHKDLPFAGIGYIEYKDGDKTVVEYSPVYSVRTVSDVATMACADVVWYQYSAETPTKPEGYANEIRENVYSPYTAQEFKLLQSLRGEKFEISSPEQFESFRTLVNFKLDDFSGKTVVLTADLDFTGKDFVPVGNNPEAGSQDFFTWGSAEFNKSAAAYFGGTFDGQGHSITGIEATFNHGYIGLFGVTNGATVKNLRLDADFENTTDKWHNGILVGLAVDTKIDSCHVSGSFKTDAWLVGGIAGGAGGTQKTVISNCISEAEVSGSTYIGGLVGYAFRPGFHVELTNCYIKAAAVKGNIGDESVNAFVGHLNSIVISNCFAVCTTPGGSLGTALAPNLPLNETEGSGVKMDAASGAISEEELKAKVEALGDAFKADENGYPVLTYGKNAAES